MVLLVQFLQRLGQRLHQRRIDKIVGRAVQRDHGHEALLADLEVGVERHWEVLAWVDGGLIVVAVTSRGPLSFSGGPEVLHAGCEPEGCQMPTLPASGGARRGPAQPLCRDRAPVPGAAEKEARVKSPTPQHEKVIPCYVFRIFGAESRVAAFLVRMAMRGAPELPALPIQTQTEVPMNLVESFADVSRFVRVRRDLHAHPELGFEEHRTSGIVAGLLREWGLEVHTGVAGTGVVGVLKCGDGPRTIGLRADLDALPLQEENHFPHRSTHDGRMHACGHDGHTTMLLAAAWHLAQSRDFSGTVNFIFQPAEEMGKAGALKMIQDGLFERFPCQAVFALHNFALGAKGQPGDFALNQGALMASSNTWRVTMVGRGTHASLPHTGIDPVGAVIDLGQQLQALVPRVIDSNERALLAVTQLQGSDAPNVIPDQAWVGGTVRTFSESATDAIETGLRRLADGIAAAHGCTADIFFRRASPPVVNHAAEARFAASVMREVVGDAAVDDAFPAVMGAEDFAHMLRVRPGCYAFIGNGDGAHRLPDHGPGPCIIHNTSFDFNDAIIPVGASYFVRLAQRWLAQP